MTAKYRPAYSNISPAREEVPMANVAAGPTGKDKDARPTMKDDWDANDRVAQCIEDSNSVIYQDVREAKSQRIQEVGETQVPERRAGKNGSTVQTGRTRISVVEEDCQTAIDMITSVQILHTRPVINEKTITVITEGVLVEAEQTSTQIMLKTYQQ
ncbi:hypothetical protein PoB_004219100 [Plakobranchus ocellatus]|uniref:Uncharacterized protein n=1 Tax=Plakobranchus ocellatus TaxID=259542 RepID=A0AAV4AX50_9GAST|nr:hypothetical protein PoB_004219100 [Plakobranchus ocellatus]